MEYSFNRRREKEEFGDGKMKKDHTIKINEDNFKILSEIPKGRKQTIINNALKEYFENHEDEINALIKSWKAFNGNKKSNEKI